MSHDAEQLRAFGSQPRGTKNDAGKRRFDLLPVGALEAVTRVLEHGAARYGDGNWRHVENARSRYFAATLRHLFAYWGGELADKDSGESHLAHACCSLLFMLEPQS